MAGSKAEYVGELGYREGEKDDGKESPEDKELREGVAGAGVTQITAGIVTNLPLSDGDLNGVNEGADGNDRPWHEANE